MKKKINKVLDAVDAELQRAIVKFPKFNSSHEGYAVLKEEVDELWDDIKNNKHGLAQQKEAIQVAAMAVRFIIDCTLD